MLVGSPLLLLGVLATLAALLGLYLLPTVIGLAKRKDNVVAISVLNIFFGLTFVGWFTPLIWSLTNNKNEKTNKEVAPTVFKAYATIFLLGFVPSLIYCSIVAFAQKADEVSKTITEEKSRNIEYTTTPEYTTSAQKLEETGIAAPAAALNTEYTKQDARYPKQNYNSPLMESEQSRNIRGQLEAEETKNKHLQSQIDEYQTALTQQTLNIEKLEQALNSQRDQSFAFKHQVDTLEKKLIATESIAMERKNDVTKMEETLGRWKSHKEQILSTDESTTTINSDLGNTIVWSNVPGFSPLSYKSDISRKLETQVFKRAACGQLISKPVQVSFRINKDGTPTEIMMDQGVHEAVAQKSLINLVRASAPFKPIITDQLDSISVQLLLSKSQSSELVLEKVLISAMGNTL